MASHTSGRVNTRQTLWGGPKDGLEVYIEHGVWQYVFPAENPHLEQQTPTPDEMNRLVGGYPHNRLMGRYQYNSMTKRFEWMGYE